MMNNVEFRALRSKAGLTQARVAARSRIDRTRLCMWENGDLSLSHQEARSLGAILVQLIGESAEQMNKLVIESRQATLMVCTSRLGYTAELWENERTKNR